MRAVLLPAALLGATALAACGTSEEKQARADANAAAAGFVPPAVISRVDFGSQMERRFRTLDRNGDDVLDRTEWPRANTTRFEALDRNKDGKVSAIEFSEGQLERFDRMDLNRDGTLTSDERGAAQGR